jgi:signal transduction histidine kinase
MELTEAARAVGKPDLSVRAPRYGRDEIGELASQFNAMADRLETSFGELERERDALRRFIQDASHELRTPLTALTTFNELLQSRAGKDAKARMDFLKESQTELARLAWIVENLLDLTRLDAGLNGLDKEEHAASQLVDEAWQSVGPASERKNSLLEKKLDLETVYCDGQRVIIVLRNLFDNAIKASPPDSRIHVSLRQSGEFSEFRIQDEGTGIEPGDIEYIFDRFFRSPKNKSPGSGLGLALAKSIVEAHGGSISVASRSGKGSCFTFRLPMPDVSPKSREEAP